MWLSLVGALGNIYKPLVAQNLLPEHDLERKLNLCHYDFYNLIYYYNAP